MKKFAISLLFNNLHFLAIGLILLTLSFKYPFFFLFYLLYLIFLFKKTKLFSFMLLLSLLLMCSNLQNIKKFNRVPDLNHYEGIIIEKNPYRYLLLTKYGKVLINTYDEFNLGDYGTFETVNQKTHNSSFDYNTYLLNKGIKGNKKLIKYELKGNGFVIAKIQEFFLNYTKNKSPKTAVYLNTLLLGKNELSSEIKNESKNLGISHILAISGLHLSIIVFLLTALLDKFFYFTKPKEIIIVIFLVFYIFLTHFSISVVRSALMLIFGIIFKHHDYLFTKLDNLSLVLILFLLYNPLSLYLMAFKLSFMASFLMVSLVNDFKKSKLTVFKIAATAFFFNLPIVLSINYELNLLTLVLSPLYACYFEILMLPLAILNFILPFTSKFVYVVFDFFELSLKFFDSLNETKLIIGSLNMFEVLIYYFLLIFFFAFFEFKERRNCLLILLSLFLIFLYERPLFNPFYEVSIYDVGQGDSILIKLPNDQGNILCDAFSNISTLLKKDGIRHLDLVIITHGHHDHIGKCLEVCKRYGLKSFYTSYYDDSKSISDLKDDLIIKRIKGGDLIKFKNITLHFLGPLSYHQNVNDNSLVFKVRLDGYDYLFTGDVEKEGELEMVNKYHDALKTDILKVAHHGSNTSSTKAFMDYAKPKLCVISVGVINSYNLPNNKLILAFKPLYRTDLDGSIKIFSLKQKIHLKKV